jgi:hypothetical protein
MAAAPWPFKTGTPSLGGPGELVLKPKAVSQQELIRRAKSRQLWAAHDARLKAIMAKVSSSQLLIASGI